YDETRASLLSSFTAIRSFSLTIGKNGKDTTIDKREKPERWLRRGADRSRDGFFGVAGDDIAKQPTHIAAGVADGGFQPGDIGFDVMQVREIPAGAVDFVVHLLGAFLLGIEQLFVELLARA